MTVEEKLIKMFEDHPRNSYSVWDAANILYDGCMKHSRPGNGARIAHIRRAAEKSESLIYFVTDNEAGHIAIIEVQ